MVNVLVLTDVDVSQVNINFVMSFTKDSVGDLGVTVLKTNCFPEIKVINNKGNKINSIYF